MANPQNGIMVKSGRNKNRAKNISEPVEAHGSVPFFKIAIDPRQAHFRVPLRILTSQMPERPLSLRYLRHLS
jgi:hypothetical protein